MAARVPRLTLITLGLVLALATEPATGKIKCYRDKQGVWRIDNSARENRTDPASHSETKVPVLPSAAAPAPAPPSQGAIRCVIDNRGIIRITNVKMPVEKSPQSASKGNAVPEFADRGPGSASSVRVKEGWQQGAQMPAQLAQLPAAPETGSGPAPAQANRRRQYGKIYFVKDRQGKFIVYNISNLEENGAERPALAGAELEALIDLAAGQHRLEPSLIKAVIKAESNFNMAARSPKGAIGLMQLMPGTADFLGLKDPRCPVENILGGSRYLRLLLDCFNGDLELALAAYNAGFQRVIQAGFQVPGIKETENFVKRVLRYFQEYRAQNRNL